MPRCLPILTPFLDRFFIDFNLQLRSHEPWKSWFFLRKNKVFSKNRFSKLASIFDWFANMPRLSFRKLTKILPNIDSKMHHFFDRFLHGFLDGQEAAKTAKTAPRGRQDSPRASQDDPKRVPKNRGRSSFFFLGRQDAPRSPHDLSKINFRSIFDRFFGDVSS